MTSHVYQNDLPDNLDLGKVIAVDSETMGLDFHRDRLCVVQLSSGDGNAHIVQLSADSYDKAVNLKKLLGDRKVLKLFHFARFDLAVIHKYLGVMPAPVYCTRTVSKLIRTYTDKHGLRDNCRQFLKIDLNKQQQSSDWGAPELSQEQIDYAAGDVLYLHQLKEEMDKVLEREGRADLAQKLFDFLPVRAELDLGNWPSDIFDH